MHIFRAALFSSALIVSSFSADAQAKQKSNKPFAVPCSKALQIGLDEVENLYDKEQYRRNKGNTDSGTEGAATQNAQRNYISCRQKNSLARIKKLAPEAQKKINVAAAYAKRLAQTRFKLIHSVSFDEKSDDPINYQMTHRAVALVEDYKGGLITAYDNRNDPNFIAEKNAAERDEKRVAELLTKLEAAVSDASDEEDFRRNFALLKQEIAVLQTAQKDVAGLEKTAAMRFIVELLTLGLPY